MGTRNANNPANIADADVGQYGRQGGQAAMHVGRSGLAKQVFFMSVLGCSGGSVFRFDTDKTVTPRVPLEPKWGQNNTKLKPKWHQKGVQLFSRIQAPRRGTILTCCAVLE